MERIRLFRAIKRDVLKLYQRKQYSSNLRNRDEVEQDLNDTLFTYDSVTGNASGVLYV